MRQKLTIRSKLTLALAIPLVGLATLVALQARDAQGDRVQVVYLSAAAGAVLFSIGVLVLANRWITRPLAELADEARVMATERLPAAVQEILETPRGADVAMPEVEPVHVRGGAEITGAVEALNLLQRAALEHAVEQAMLRRVVADSFVNLGRRNQNLLARQLELISQLEAEESDPETLEHLFSLDHLATRMRRNAESLLVLAGEEPARKWTQPVPIGDVVRAALGEVEQYSRVQLHPVDSTTIVGSAVADVSHILAELIENACAFSPPHSTVDVYARRGDRGLIVTIVDSGMGMPAEEIERANDRLRADQSFAIAPSRYLGHYVVANLSARHGIEVGLQPSPAGGVTATVVLPAAVLADWEPPRVVVPAPGAPSTHEPVVQVDPPVVPAPVAEVGAAVVPAPVLFDGEAVEAEDEDAVAYAEDAVEAVVVEEPEAVEDEPSAPLATPLPSLPSLPEVQGWLEPVPPAAPETPVEEVEAVEAVAPVAPAAEPAPEPEPPAARPTAAATFALMRDLGPSAERHGPEATHRVDAGPDGVEHADAPAGDTAVSCEPDVDDGTTAVEIAIATPIQDDLLPQVRGRRHGRRGRGGEGPRVAPLPPQVIKVAASAPPIAETPVATPAPVPEHSPAAASALSDVAASHAAPVAPAASPPVTSRVPSPATTAPEVPGDVTSTPASPTATASDEPAPAAGGAAPPPLPKRGVDMASGRVWDRAPEPAQDGADEHADDAAAPASPPNYALFAAFRAAAERGRADATGGGR